jgi:hypothetical protein
VVFLEAKEASAEQPDQHGADHPDRDHRDEEDPVVRVDGRSVAVPCG